MGNPATEELCRQVYEHIVSPNDRSKRLAPDVYKRQFEQRMKKSEDRARNFGRSKFETLISVRDRATEYIEKAAGKAKDFAGRSYDAFLRVKNSDAMHGIAEVGGSLKTIAGRA